MNTIISRKDHLTSMGVLTGALSLQTLFADQTENPLVERKSHFKARAKQVIFLSMRGATSHLDTFDYKPKLKKDHGKGGKYGSGNRKSSLLSSPWEFKQHGKSGLWMSSLFPHLSEHADKLCMLHGMHTDQPNHVQATMKIHTGNAQFVRPSLGAWCLYGLGTNNQNLPGFMVVESSRGGAANYGNSFLPAVYQGTQLMLGGNRRSLSGVESIQFPNIKHPQLQTSMQRKQLDFIQALNRKKLKEDRIQPQVEGAIQSLELAYRMQDTMPSLLDISKESAKTKAMYGVGGEKTNTFGGQCLLARRMIESGVRFVEIANGGWDHHNNLKEEMEDHCAQIDKPIAGLLTDLKQRGLLKDTLVIWASEFGRTPHGQGGDGRDHNHKGFTTFMAGAGVKPGFSYGSTDDYGYEAVEGKMSIHDWHATVLHLLGLDHKKLTYHYAGRDFRLTDVHGHVAKKILS